MPMGQLRHCGPVTNTVQSCRYCSSHLALGGSKAVGILYADSYWTMIAASVHCDVEDRQAALYLAYFVHCNLHGAFEK
jgi:hypothetical protein